MSARNRYVLPVVSVTMLILMCLLPTLAQTGSAVDQSGQGAPLGVKWGRMETFDATPTGTISDFGDISIYPSPATDLVILDGKMWVMFRDNETREILRYAPAIPQEGWNISYEAFAPREGSSYYGVGKLPGRYSLISSIKDQNGLLVAGLELRVGPRGEEGVYTYSLQNSSWYKVVDDILPAYSRDTRTEGSDPDHYTVAFAYDGKLVNLTVLHSHTGLIYRSSLSVSNDHKPGPVLYCNDNTGITQFPTVSGNIGNYGGWMLDDMAARPTGSSYPNLAPLLETERSDRPVWMTVDDENGKPIPEAMVTFGDVPALFNASSGRHEASYSRSADWAVPTNYKVDLPYMTIEGKVKVTSTFWDENVSIAEWWNGWDWATVFGLDDCMGPETSISHYSAFDHPTTAYVMSLGGYSSILLPTRSEIGMHAPHDYTTWMKKTWEESTTATQQTHDDFNRTYEYASRWDMPAAGGAGDTYISFANPGNSATYQMMFAQYAAGTRIEGISSNHYNGAAGNSTWIGSYWPQGAWNVDGNVSWRPLTPMDLMDSSRQWSTDNANQPYDSTIERFSEVAERGGLLRVYGHPEYGIIGDRYKNVTAALNYLDDMKTDGSPENWKATDGEVASYIYGSRTTQVTMNRSESSTELLVYDVARKDPRQAGYWNVPVTLRVSTGGKSVTEVRVIEDGREITSLTKGNGGLPNLNQARVMGCGYDQRGDLYVSHFWNGSAKLIVRLGSPDILNEAPRYGIIGQQYDFTAISTLPDLGNNTWTLNSEQASWLSVISVTATTCSITGTPVQSGKQNVSISVHDDDSICYLNWTIVVGIYPDVTKPITNLTMSGEALEWNNMTVQMTLVPEDFWSGVHLTHYRIDGGPWWQYEKPIQFEDEGWHQFQYYSEDNANNEEDVVMVEFGIDQTSPEIELVTLNGQMFPKGEANVVQVSWDNQSSITSMRVQVDGETVYDGQYQSMVRMPDLVPGKREVRVVVDDAAGNEASVNISIMVGKMPSAPGIDGILFILGSLVFMMSIILMITVVTRRPKK